MPKVNRKTGLQHLKTTYAQTRRTILKALQSGKWELHYSAYGTSLWSIDRSKGFFYRTVRSDHAKKLMEEKGMLRLARRDHGGICTSYIYRLGVKGKAA